MEYESHYIRRGLIRLMIGAILLIALAITSEVMHYIHSKKVEAIKAEMNR